MIDLIQPQTSGANWSNYICTAKGIEIHYLRTGGDKPPLIALHGLFGSGACLAPLARTLEDDFDIVLPDARGHGGSSPHAEEYNYRSLADDVCNLIAKLELHAPILLGHSMGGMTAAVVANKLGLAVAAVVLVDPTFISLEWQREVFEGNVADEHRRSLSSTKDDLLAQARLRSPNRSAEMIEFLVDARLNTSINAVKILTPPYPDYRGLIEKIRVPTLIVVGDKGIVSRDTAHELHNLNPLVRYDVIPEGGHGLPYDAPEQLSAAIALFLADNCPLSESPSSNDLGQRS